MLLVRDVEPAAERVYAVERGAGSRRSGSRELDAEKHRLIRRKLELRGGEREDHLREECRGCQRQRREGGRLSRGGAAPAPCCAGREGLWPPRRCERVDGASLRPMQLSRGEGGGAAV